MWRNIQAGVVLLASAMILKLAIQNDLDIYIHPRYVTFTIVASVISLVLSIGHFSTKKAESSGVISLIVAAGVIGAGLLVTPRPLTSAAAAQRTPSAPSTPTSADSAPLAQLFANSSKNLTLWDWARITEANTSPAYYKDRAVTVSGFIYDGQKSNQFFTVSRFVVTCCAVDAQPIGLPVDSANWRNTYKEDQWVEITGTFEPRQLPNGGTRLTLIPTAVIKINEPEHPYANER